MSSKDQKRFICYEIALLTVKAALSTRDKTYTIYKSTVKDHQRKIAKKSIRNVLTKIESDYSPKMLNENDHTRYISDTAAKLTSNIGEYLRNDEFRVGIAQKLVNMHLKYLWCAGFIGEPPHCPIDGIIRDKVRTNYADFNYDWIRSTDIKEYQTAVKILHKQAEARSQTIAQWELTEFRRRNDI